MYNLNVYVTTVSEGNDTHIIIFTCDKNMQV